MEWRIRPTQVKNGMNEIATPCLPPFPWSTAELQSCTRNSIGRALAALLGQERAAELEIIVIDDGSDRRQRCRHRADCLPRRQRSACCTQPEAMSARDPEFPFAARPGGGARQIRLLRRVGRLGFSGLFRAGAAPARSRSRQRPVLRRSDVGRRRQQPAVRRAARRYFDRVACAPDGCRRRQRGKNCCARPTIGSRPAAADLPHPIASPGPAASMRGSGLNRSPTALSRARVALKVSGFLFEPEIVASW